MNTDITPATGRLNLETATAIIATIRYRPGWTFRLDPGPCLAFQGPSVDAYHVKQSVTLFQRKPLPFLHTMTPAALIGFVYESLQQLELHELGEFFTVEGARPFDPHREPPETWTICQTCGQRTDAGALRIPPG